MIKLGTYLNRYEGLSFEERVRMIKSVGFDFIAFGMAYLEENKPEDVIDLCEKIDLPIDNIHLTGGKTTEIWAEGEIGDKVVKRYCREIRLCSQYGIKKGVAHVTWGHKEPDGVSEVGLSRLEKIAQVAEECGFVLGLENSVYPEYLYASMERLKNYKSIGHTFDSGHRNAFAPEHDFLAAFGDRLCVTHIQDNDGRDDLHLFPMDGTIDWNKVAGELAKTSFARERICAEVTNGINKELPDMTADQIREYYSRLAVMDTPHVKIEDGRYAVYQDLNFEGRLCRIYEAMKKLGAMIEVNAK